MGLFFIGMFAGVAYFIFKIYRIYDPSQSEKYRFVKEFLTFFGKQLPFLTCLYLLLTKYGFPASVSLALVVLTIINALICCLNFGKGLKPHCKC